MDMNIENLRQLGAFTGAPVEKEIVWQQGEEELKGVVFVRRLSYHSAVGDLLSRKGGSADRIAERIANCICDAEGKPLFTAQDITGESDPDRGAMDANLTVAFLAAISEVNTSAGKPQATH